jgi:hypothetical protein
MENKSKKGKKKIKVELILNVDYERIFNTLFVHILKDPMLRGELVLLGLRAYRAACRGMFVEEYLHPMTPSPQRTVGTFERRNRKLHQCFPHPTSMIHSFFQAHKITHLQDEEVCHRNLHSLRCPFARWFILRTKQFSQHKGQRKSPETKPSLQTFLNGAKKLARKGDA